MTDNVHSKGSTIWAHAASLSGVDALREVLMRAQIIEPSLSYKISVPASAKIYENYVTILQNKGSSSGSNFLKETMPDLCLWTEDSINTPLFHLNYHFSHPVVLVNLKLTDLLERPWIWRKTVVRQVLRPVCYAFTENILSLIHI